MIDASGETTGEAEIELRDVSKAYGSVEAVDRVSLPIQRGEFVTLLGPSGAGKSTVLMMIAGFVEPTSGQIQVGGQEITTVPPHRRNLGVVFQNYALFPHMTVFANVAYPMWMRGIANSEVVRRVREMLALVRLADKVDRYPQLLSGGEQQRVALARALVFSPRALLMDEPLGALDRKLRQQVQVEIRTLQRRLGITTIHVTHDQDEAFTMSDRVAVMSRGRIEQVGTPREVYAQPATAFVAEFVGESNQWKGHVKRRADGVADLVTATGTRVLLPPGCYEEDLPANVYVRPEAVSFCEKGAPGVQVMGTIVEAIYLGDAVRYLVKTREGDVVKVKSVDGRAERGDEVALTWATDSVHVYQEPD
jgi:putative spermidine/putrescine transport system ATP-binding protein